MLSVWLELATLVQSISIGISYVIMFMYASDNVLLYIYVGQLDATAFDLPHATVNNSNHKTFRSWNAQRSAKLAAASCVSRMTLYKMVQVV